MKYRGKKYRLYITSRGIGVNGVLKTLENFTEKHQSMFTVVSSLSGADWIKRKYPHVKVISVPKELDTAALKRRFCLTQPGAHRNIVFNDDLTLYGVDPEANKAVRLKGRPDLWVLHIKNLIMLSTKYDAVGIKFYPFSYGNILQGKYLEENHCLEFGFTVDPRAFEVLAPPKFKYYDMRELVLELLVSGFSTARYSGILAQNTFDPVKSKVHADRKEELRVTEEAQFLKRYPNICVLGKSRHNFSVKFDKARQLGLQRLLALKPI